MADKIKFELQIKQLSMGAKLFLKLILIENLCHLCENLSLEWITFEKQKF